MGWAGWPLQIRGHGPAFGGGPGAVVGHHAGGFPVPGEHHRGRGRAARGEFRGEPHAATVGGHAAREAGG